MILFSKDSRPKQFYGNVISNIQGPDYYAMQCSLEMEKMKMTKNIKRKIQSDFDTKVAQKRKERYKSQS